MNITEKIYCRIFQFCFKIAIPLLPYRTPVILEHVEDIPDILKKEKINRVLLVIDNAIRKLGITKTLEDNLKSRGIPFIVYDDIVSNPTIKNVEEGREIYIKNQCDGLIAFGGGSAIDCAKGIGARIARPEKSIVQMAGILKVFKKTPLITAIPTTAGTGSETTVAALITDSETKRKYMVGDFPLTPGYAVLDPDNVKSLPPHITASVGMDVLIHAIEGYIGNSTTKKTREEALRATSLVYQNLYKSYQNGLDLEARKNMLLASYLGGSVLTVSYVGYCHAIAHALGGLYGSPHGLTNAIIISYILEAYGEKIYKKLKDLGIAAGLYDKNIDEKEGALLFIKSIKELNSKMGIGEKIEELKKEDAEKIVSAALEEANPVYPVPVLMGREELTEIVYKLIK